MTTDTEQPQKSDFFWVTLNICVAGFVVLLIYSIIGYHRYDECLVKEVALSLNLQRLRLAITAFKSNTGVYPADLNDLIAATEKDVTARITPGSYDFPYFEPKGGIAGSGLPVNPFAYDGEKMRPDPSQHWRYDPHTGKVTSAVDGKTQKGVAYKDL